MARSNQQGPGPLGEARITAQQLVLYQGRNVAEVSADAHGVTVWRKRDVGTKYERRFFPNKRVVAYVPGEGGTAASTAMALVLTTVVLHSVQGAMERDDYATIITDDLGNAHVFPHETSELAGVEIRETAERPSNAPDDQGEGEAQADDDDAPDVPPDPESGEPETYEADDGADAFDEPAPDEDEPPFPEDPETEPDPSDIPEPDVGEDDPFEPVAPRRSARPAAAPQGRPTRAPVKATTAPVRPSRSQPAQAKAQSKRPTPQPAKGGGRRPTAAAPTRGRRGADPAWG